MGVLPAEGDLKESPKLYGDDVCLGEFRNWTLGVVIHPYFESFILIAIFVNCGFMASANPPSVEESNPVTDAAEVYNLSNISMLINLLL